MRRRNFMKAVALGLVQFGLPKGLAATADDALKKASGRRKGKVFACLEHSENSSLLRIFDWDDHSFTDHEVPLPNPHSAIQDRQNPQIVYLFEVGGSLAKVDLKTGKSTVVPHVPNKNMFNGHGIQTRSGKQLLCSEILSGYQVKTVVRDASTLELVSVAPSECDAIHQLVTMPNSTILACGNMASMDLKTYGGGITFYDYEKQKVVRRIDLPYPILHITALSPDEVLGVARSTQKDSRTLIGEDMMKGFHENFGANGDTPLPLISVKMDGTKKIFWDESQKHLFKGGFGIAGVPSQNGFLSSYQNSGKVLLWRNSEIAHVFSVDCPGNIMVSGDESEFMVVAGKELKIFSLKTLKEVESPKGFPTVIALASYREA